MLKHDKVEVVVTSKGRADAMQEIRARVNANGRVVIPAAYRQALGIRPGDEVVLRLDPEQGEIRLTTAQLALERARRLIRRYVRTDADLTQSLIDDRRAEAARDG